MTNSNSPSELPDKGYLYGKFQELVDWQNNLHKKAAHKALDIPLDNEMIHVEKKGIGIGGVLGVAAITAASILGSQYLMSRNNKPPTTTTAPVEKPTVDNDTQYELEFVEPK